MKEKPPLLHKFVCFQVHNKRLQSGLQRDFEIIKTLLSRIYAYKLKTLDIIGNCQRPVFSLAVSQHMHEVTNFELNRSSKLRENSERKIILVTQSCVFSKLDFETSNSKS